MKTNKPFIPDLKGRVEVEVIEDRLGQRVSLQPRDHAGQGGVEHAHKLGVGDAVQL